jgi:hypothetical protein
MRRLESAVVREHFPPPVRRFDIPKANGGTRQREQGPSPHVLVSERGAPMAPANVDLLPDHVAGFVELCVHFHRKRLCLMFLRAMIEVINLLSQGPVRYALSAAT